MFLVKEPLNAMIITPFLSVDSQEISCKWRYNRLVSSFNPNHKTVPGPEVVISARFINVFYIVAFIN